MTLYAIRFPQYVLFTLSWVWQVNDLCYIHELLPTLEIPMYLLILLASSFTMCKIHSHSMYGGF